MVNLLVLPALQAEWKQATQAKQRTQILVTFNTKETRMMFMHILYASSCVTKMPGIHRMITTEREGVMCLCCLVHFKGSLNSVHKE